jgi:phosphate transport system substrate-binding protein
VVAGNTPRGVRLRGTALGRSLGGVLLAALALVLTSCASPMPIEGNLVAHVSGAPAGTITEKGSTLLYPLMQTWAQAYHQRYPDAMVSTAGGGSSAGLAAAMDGTTDIGASDAYLSSGDLVKKPTLLNIPLAVSAQTVVYNLPNVSANLELNGTVLAEIYSGTITMWNDKAIAALNPHVSLPAMRIVPFHRSDGSGDTFLFASYLSAQDTGWNSAIGYGTTVNWPKVAGQQQEDGNANMVAGCKATPGCLAYVGISYLKGALADGLGEAELVNAAGNPELPTAPAIKDALASFVSLTPSDETISLIDGPAPDGYPIINYEYAVVSTSQPSAAKASALAAFLTWAITSGNNGTYLDQVGFGPLPSALVTLGEQQIKEIKG